jgi:hypothetical protein
MEIKMQITVIGFSLDEIAPSKKAIALTSSFQITKVYQMNLTIQKN